MMRDNNLMDKYEDCIRAMGEVVRLGGFGTSVTPVSQFYFQQAFNNVIFGPWEKIAEGYGKMVLGYFGKTPVEPDPAIVKIAAEKLELEPTTENPVDINDRDPNKGVDAARKMLKENSIEETEENIFIAAACKQKGIDFLLGKAEINGVRKGALTKKEEKPAAAPGGDGAYTVMVDGKKFAVDVKGDKATVNGKTYAIGVADGAESASSSSVAHESADSIEIAAPMNAKVVKVNVDVGDHVSNGDVLFVVEAMKMEVDVKSSAEGTVSSIAVATGEQVTAGQAMASIN
jgi:pyruvate carboxylase subunit B